MNAKVFILSDPDSSELNICLLSYTSVDYFFKVSKNHLYFEAEPKLAQLIRGKEAQILAELERSPTLFDFCQRIQHLLIPIISPQQIRKVKSHGNYFQRVLDDIKEIGWDKVTDFDTTLSFYEMAIHDAKDRTITLRFEIPPSFPQIPPKVHTNLPMQFQFDWNSSTKLIDVAQFYQSQLPQFDQLWTQLEDLDNNATIIEPRGQAPLSCLTRRVLLSDVLQLQLDLSSTDLQYAPMHLKFIGPDKIAHEMKKKYDQGCLDWNPDESLRVNLERILEITFPLPDDEATSETDLDCSICYVERLGAELPDIICGHCRKKFHRSCLVEWLSSRPGVQQSYQSITGPCPYCEKMIQCSLKD